MSKLNSLFNRVFNANAPANTPVNNHPALRFPAQIADKDCVPELIGKGTFGSVYKVRKNGKTAAVKVIDCPSDYELELAKKECRMMEAVAFDPHTVNYLDSLILPAEHGHTVYILQEFLTSFEQYYNANKMTEADIIRLGIDVCKAMIACRNAGFYHLDIQPKNLFVTEDGQFKLGDFGSAAYLADLKNLTNPQHLRGTLAYMAPEVYKSRLYSEQSELYSLGILLYTLLNHGILPFADQMNKEEAIHTRLNGTRVPFLSIDSKPLSRVLNLVCSPTPRMRFDSFEELLRPLKNALKEERPTPNLTPSTTFTYDDMNCGAAPPPFTIPHPSNNFNFGDVGSVCPSPQIFDADSFACTCAIMPPSDRFPTEPIAFTNPCPPPQIFDADAFAYSCAIMPPSDRFPTEPIAFTNPCPPPQIFDADSFACTCAISAPAPAPAPRMSEVQFSAIAPETAVKGDYTLVQLYMYEQDYAYIVEEAVAEADEPVVRKTSGIFEVEQHARIKVVLTSSDVEIMEGEDEQIWYGKYLAFDFAFELPYNLSKKQILLKAAIYINDLPATRLLLKLKTGAVQTAKIEVERQDVTHVYMSYAREDQAKVAGLVQAIQAVRPEWNVFFDIYSLKCGSDWEHTLYKNLDVCDTLFLCWSRSASNSPWVEKEWRYMLSSKGPDSIEPMPVEPTELCPPPKELSMKYFNNSLLYLAQPLGNV